MRLPALQAIAQSILRRKFPSKYKPKPILKRKFPSVYKALRKKAPPKICPSKRAFEKYKPWGLFSEFYGNVIMVICHAFILSISFLVSGGLSLKTVGTASAFIIGYIFKPKN